MTMSVTRPGPLAAGGSAGTFRPHLSPAAHCLQGNSCQGSERPSTDWKPCAVFLHSPVVASHCAVHTSS